MKTRIKELRARYDLTQADLEKRSECAEKQYFTWKKESITLRSNWLTT